MEWKEFLRPTKEKLKWSIILVAIFIVAAFFFIPDGSAGVPTVKGLPLPIYSYQELPAINEGFIIPFLIIDIIFWYVVACVVVRQYENRDKVK